MTRCKIYFTGVIDPQTGETTTELMQIDDDKPESEDLNVPVDKNWPIPEIQSYYAEYAWNKEDNHAIRDS